MVSPTPGTRLSASVEQRHARGLDDLRRDETEMREALILDAAPLEAEQEPVRRHTEAQRRIQLHRPLALEKRNGQFEALRHMQVAFDVHFSFVDEFPVAVLEPR